MPTLIILAGVVIVFFILARYWSDWLWFSQAGYSKVLATEWISKGLLFVGAGAIMGGAIWLNLRLAYRNRPMYVPTTTQHLEVDRYRDAFEPIRRVVFIIAPIVAGLFAGSTISGQWKTVLLAMNGQSFGRTDPEFGIDLSFYVFSLPFWRMLVAFLLTVGFFSAVAAVFTHYLYGGLTVSGPGQRITRAARIHVGVLAGVITLLISVNYWLDRYSILSKTGEKFDGAAFTDVNAVLPAKAILAVIGVLVAVLFFYTSARGTWHLPAIGVALMVASAIVIGGIYPALVQQVRVSPNAQKLEAEFIQRNIDSTRAAYGLDKIEPHPYTARTDTEAGQLREDAESAASIRLLDPSLVSQTFRQLQQNKQYYQFPEILSVDRYRFDDSIHDTLIAVRELDLDSGSERTWVNDHTVFTHGFGVVAAFGNTVTDGGRPKFFQHGIPSIGEIGDYEPRIYFSPQAPSYSIVGAPEGTDPWELDFPDDDAPDGMALNTFDGDGGPSIGNLWNRAVFAARMGSQEILFSERVTSESQIIYHRDPIERVARVAPYLTLEGRAYPAVVDSDTSDTKRVVWIVDGYTTSNEYPYSARQQLSTAVTDSLTGATPQPGIGVVAAAMQNDVNYIRNSVKAVVDAYDGSVELYAWDPDDPILQSWDAIFPTALKPISEINGSLMSHLRYPEDMFKVQRELLTKYHVTDANSFYTGGDFWRTPSDPTQGTSQVKQPPYYMSLKMPEQDAATFSLTSAFILDTSDRNVLTGYLSVNAEPGTEDGVVDPDYGTMRLLELPRDQTASGPGQVQNDFDTDAEAANELNILGRGNSEVLRGNLLTLPVGGGLLYVQPVYVQASAGTQYPLLRRVLVSFGDTIGFAATLDQALDQVFGGDSGVTTPDAGREPGDEEPGTGENGPVDANARLSDALRRANEAIKASEEALAAGDWAAYGTAQNNLNTALVDAIRADEEITGETILGDPEDTDPDALPTDDTGTVDDAGTTDESQG